MSRGVWPDIDLIEDMAREHGLIHAPPSIGKLGPEHLLYFALGAANAIQRELDEALDKLGHIEGILNGRDDEGG